MLRLCAKHWSCKDGGHCLGLRVSMVQTIAKEVYILSYVVPERASCYLRRFKKKKRKTQLLRRDQHFSFLKELTIFPDKIGVWWLPVRKQNAVMSEMLEIVMQYVSVVVKQRLCWKKKRK